MSETRRVPRASASVGVGGDPARGDQADRLFRGAWALCGGATEAQELAVETVTTATRARSNRGNAQLVSLMAALCDLTAHRERLAIPDTFLFATPREHPAAGEVYGLVAALPERYADALVAVDIFGLSYHDAARALGISESHLGTRLFRARREIAQRLDSPTDIEEPAEAQLIEIAAFADGSATDTERLSTRITQSPELQTLVAEQQRALEQVITGGVSAPRELREKLAPLTPKAPPRRPVGLLAPALAILGVLILGAIALRPSSHSSGASIAGIVKLETKGAVATTPRRNPLHTSQLELSEDGVAFPYWGSKFKWRATGSRTDTVAGRATTTVFYGSGTQKAAYTIVGGVALVLPANAHVITRGTIHFAALTLDNRKVISWTRDKHTCVLSSPNVSTGTLLKLAVGKTASTR